MKYQESELEYKQLLKVPTVTSFNDKAEGVKTFKIAFIDVETTGLSTTSDEIIELAYVIVECDAQGNMYEVLHRYDCFNQPSVMPLPDKIIQITGITNEDVKGQAIDWEQVKAELADVVLLVAHNANFDRRMVERYQPDFFSQKLWGCSVNDADWEMFGVGGKKQEWLLYSICNAWYTAHRAIDDVNALAYLVHTKDPNGRPALYTIMQNAKQGVVVLKATGSAYDEKYALNEAGYRWDGKARVWFKTINQGHFIANESEILAELKTAAPSCNPTLTEIPPTYRYSVRSDM